MKSLAKEAFKPSNVAIAYLFVSLTNMRFIFEDLKVGNYLWAFLGSLASVFFLSMFTAAIWKGLTAK